MAQKMCSTEVCEAAVPQQRCALVVLLKTIFPLLQSLFKPCNQFERDVDGPFCHEARACNISLERKSC